MKVCEHYIPTITLICPKDSQLKKFRSSKKRIQLIYKGKSSQFAYNIRYTVLNQFTIKAALWFSQSYVLFIF